MNRFLFIYFLGLLLLTISTGCGKKLNYNEHIAPLINEQCAGCHHNGGIAPFSLTSYSEVKRKAKTIARVTKKRTMPPWPADPGYSHFIGERYLTDAQIEMIGSWVSGGAPEGPAELKPKPYKPPGYRSSIGKPDLVLALDTVQLYPDMKDRFFLIKIPGQIPKDTWVRAVEFVAGAQDLVHHFNGHLLLYREDAKKSLFDGDLKVEITEGEYTEDFGKLKLENDDGSRPPRIHSAVNYLPGVFGTLYPDGIGTFRLTKNFAFVGNDLHYGPTDKKVVDQSYINLFFTSKPPDRPVSEIMLGTNGVAPIVPPLQIPANKITRHVTRFKVGESISILTVNPHLHLLGKSFLAYAVKPNGDTIPLIRIPKWDFRWQYFYTFTRMVPIPKGSEIVAEAVFDNTTGNPDNPNNPPQKVGERLEFGGASMRATDEMFQFIVTYTPFRKGDESVTLKSP